MPLFQDSQISQLIFLMVSYGWLRKNKRSPVASSRYHRVQNVRRDYVVITV